MLHGAQAMGMYAAYIRAYLQCGQDELVRLACRWDGYVCTHVGAVKQKGVNLMPGLIPVCMNPVSRAVIHKYIYTYMSFVCAAVRKLLIHLLLSHFTVVANDHSVHTILFIYRNDRSYLFIVCRISYRSKMVSPCRALKPHLFEHPAPRTSLLCSPRSTVRFSDY